MTWRAFWALDLSRARLLLQILVLGLLWVCVGARSPAGEPPPENLVRELADSAQEKARRLAARLETCRAAGHDIADPDAALAVAELFCGFSRRDATQPGLRESAVRSMVYINQMLEGELHRADAVLGGRTHYPVIPPWQSAMGVSWEPHCAAEMIC